MGTLGKAYGSFGAFILASEHIVEYLINRAKPIIYATSLSLYDTLLAHKSLNYILKNTKVLKQEIKNMLKLSLQNFFYKTIQNYQKIKYGFIVVLWGKQNL